VKEESSEDSSVRCKQALKSPKVTWVQSKANKVTIKPVDEDSSSSEDSSSPEDSSEEESDTPARRVS